MEVEGNKCETLVRGRIWIAVHFALGPGLRARALHCGGNFETGGTFHRLCRETSPPAEKIGLGAKRERSYGRLFSRQGAFPNSSRFSFARSGRNHPHGSLRPLSRGPYRVCAPSSVSCAPGVGHSCPSPLSNFGPNFSRRFAAA